jgi:hypothetical protein
MNYIPKVGIHKISDNMPKYDFTAFEKTDLVNTIGIVAASQKQLEEQIKSRMRVDPTAKEIRYFYYEVVSESGR